MDIQTRIQHHNVEKTYGKHILLELIDCDADELKKVRPVKEALLEAAEASHATILDHHFHQFAPQGVSGVVLIAESHFTIHTWPEDAYAAVDIFTCGEQMKPKKALEVLEEKFNADKTIISIIARGK